MTKSVVFPGGSAVLFAGFPVRDFSLALAWYERLFEPPQVSRRLHFLRGWSHGKHVEEIFS